MESNTIQSKNTEEMKESQEEIIEIDKERDWKNISSEFTKELQKEWEGRGFTYWQTNGWIDAGLGIGDAEFAWWLKDIKQKSPANILNQDNEKFLRNKHNEYLAWEKNKIVWAVPLERLYNIYYDLNNYHNKWNREKVVNLLGSSPALRIYTGAQYLNRAVSLTNGILLLTKSVDSQTGGIIVTVNTAFEFITSFSKDKIFEVEEERKNYSKLIEDSENLHNRYQELAEILKPIICTSDSGKLGEIIRILREKEKFLVEENDSRESKIFRRKLSKFWRLLKEGNIFNSWSTLKKEIGDEWEKRGAERKEFKNLVKILQEVVSEYRQGTLPDSEIEKKIENRMLELRTPENYQTVDLDKHFEEKDAELIAQQVQLSK